MLDAQRNIANVGKPLMECLSEPDMSHVYVC